MLVKIWHNDVMMWKYLICTNWNYRHFIIALYYARGVKLLKVYKSNEYDTNIQPALSTKVNFKMIPITQFYCHIFYISTAFFFFIKNNI